ncbi:MAG: hypothetical protein ACT4OO_04350 [Nitrospiraceae bacterium]
MLRDICCGKVTEVIPIHARYEVSEDLVGHVDTQRRESLEEVFSLGVEIGHEPQYT